MRLRQVVLVTLLCVICVGVGALGATRWWAMQSRDAAYYSSVRLPPPVHGLPPAESDSESVESSESSDAARGLPPDQRQLTCFRGNAERNLSGVGPVPRHPKLLWRFRTKGKLEGSSEHRGDPQVKPGTLWEGTGWTGQPCIRDGKVWFGSTDSNVYCLDLATGKQLMSYGNHHNIKGSITVAGDRIYHGGRDNKIHCYTLDGKMVWETRIAQDTDSNPVLVDNTLYIGGEDNSVYALDPAAGKIRWRYTPTQGSCECSPCYAEGVLAIGSSNGMLYCLDPKKGERIWEFATGGDGDPTPVYWKGRIYHAVETGGSVERGKVHCLDLGTGEKVWQKDMPRGIWATVAVSRKWDRVYVGCNNGSLYALNSNTGETIWERKLGTRVWSSPVVTDGCILVGVRDGTMWCLEEETGKPMWVFDETGDIDSTPAVADGVIVIGSQNGWIYAIGEDPTKGRPDPHWFRAGPDFTVRPDHEAVGIPTVMSSAPDSKQYNDTHAGCTDHLRVPVYGPGYTGPRDGGGESGEAATKPERKPKR